MRKCGKNKTRLEKNLKAGAFKPVAEEPVAEDEELPTFRVRTKSFPVKPMSVEDAVLQMLLLEHDFFLFRNVETGNLNVVYKRADGDYGLIIPDRALCRKKWPVFAGNCRLRNSGSLEE